jgi:hydroxyacylglutathione hydrolase
MSIQKFVNGKWKQNAYILSNQNECLLIDPGGSFYEISEYILSQNLKLLAILNTHGHYDHVVEVENLANKFGCPFYLHSKDEKLLKSANFYLKLFEGDCKILIPKIDHYLDNYDTLQIGNFSIKILFTPGHTEGSVCFLIETNLFSGDTLFKTDIGRLDLPGANKLKMKESLRGLASLSEDFSFYPGHGGNFKLREALLNNSIFVNFISE